MVTGDGGPRGARASGPQSAQGITPWHPERQGCAAENPINSTLVKRNKGIELHIEAQHTEVDSPLQDWIRARCEALNTPHEDIVHVRFTLVKHPRHLRGSDEVRVVLTLSGKIVNVTRVGDTLEDALYAVFDVLERALHDFRSLRRGVSKDPGPRIRGRIVRLFPDQSYGFIATDTHREVYFRANAVHGIPFTKLQVDTVVNLDIEAGRQGPQATRVTPHWP